MRTETNTILFRWRGLISALSAKSGRVLFPPKNVNLIVDQALYYQMIDNFQNGDPFIVEKINVEKNILKITLSHAGGKNSHRFSILWDGAFVKSKPPQIKLVAVNHSRFYWNETYSSQILTIDLQEFMGKTYVENIGVFVVNAYDGSILN